MDRLPIEILDMIFDKIIWHNNLEELFRLRAVSRRWKSVVERAGFKVFKYWYNRCKNEIPEEHLQDIVQTKYPLVAHPWQELYWVDSGLAHVAKNAYEIWKNFPADINDEFDPSLNNGITDVFENYPEYCFIVALNDKYFAISFDDDDDDEEEFTLITRVGVYRWDNIQQCIKQYDLKGFCLKKACFYSTEKGTFTVLSCKAHEDYKTHILIYPVDNNFVFSSNSTVVESRREYFFTQNECFYMTVDDSTKLRILEHKILMENGFETSTIIGPVALQGQCKVEICGSTLYVMHASPKKIIISKYEISRNSDGKLSFTPAESIVLDDGNGEFNLIYSQIVRCIWPTASIDSNLSIMDNVFAWKKFNSFLDQVFAGYLKILVVHANYVFCENDDEESIFIFQKDHLIECMESYNPDDFDDDLDNPHFPKYACVSTANILDSISSIRIIYIGSKAKLLVSDYAHHLYSIDFY